ncbi:MAG: PilZ domain-containing protein [Thermodesulfobacteriota bacterium]|nr:PilZ domain-containing protein [Thermodesulfobacteriota bacterium]
MTKSDRQVDRYSLTARLHSLFQDVSRHLESASTDEKQRLLTFLEDWKKKQERRKHHRKPCSIAVTFSTKDFLSRDTIRDISPGGAFLETPEPLSVGDEITLMLSPPGSGELIDCIGRVAWTPPRGVGIEFTSTPSKELEKILTSP